MEKTYLKEFLKDKKKVASIIPSSKFTIKKIIQHVDFEKTKLIIEHGPATGCITKELLKKMKQDAELHVFETNKSFCEELRKIKDARLKIHNTTAENTSQKINKKADIIISGVPLTTLPRKTSSKIVQESYKTLKKQGKYIHYQFSPLAKKIIKEQFKPKTQYELLNIPPLFVHVSTKTNTKAL